MAQHGGYRKPARPAPVSGPGRLSRRTDGGPAQNVTRLPNAGYGESRDFEQIQSGAPMEAATPTPAAGPAPAAAPAGGAGIGDLAALLGGGGPSMAPPTPLTNETQRPGEPLTAGVPVGPGPGPSPQVLAPSRRVSDLLERMLGNDMTGELADLYINARRRGI